MYRLLKALLITGVATGVAAVVLKQLDLDAPSSSGADDPFAVDPDEMGEEDVQRLMNELGSMLNL